MISIPQTLREIIHRDVQFNARFPRFANSLGVLDNDLAVPTESDIMLLFRLLLTDPIRQVAYHGALVEIEAGKEYQLDVTPNLEATSDNVQTLLEICHAWWDQFGYEQCGQTAWWHDEFLKEYFQAYPQVLNGPMEDTGFPFKVALIPRSSNIWAMEGKKGATVSQIVRFRETHKPHCHGPYFLSALINPVVIRGDQSRFVPRGTTEERLDNAYHRQFDAPPLRIPRLSGDFLPYSFVDSYGLRPSAGCSPIRYTCKAERVAFGPLPLSVAS